MNYETVIGLEVHVELKTEAKVFCGCAARFGAEPNTHVCPGCLGMPGVLPVLNKKAVEFCIKAGLALQCRIAPFSMFDRKQYFYPDLPQAYQISQGDLPLCTGGELKIVTPGGEEKIIRLNRIHLEEEAGRTYHSGAGATGYSLLDFNRSGLPLIEIVTEPDLRSPAEAKIFLEKLQEILRYIEVSDCKMEEGSFRCDANISVRPAGSQEFGRRMEIKNLNSFKAIQSALTYEANRLGSLLAAGTPPEQEESRGWDETRGMTFFMRPKEKATDYRYFPDPDLPPLVIAEEWVEEIRAGLPELPEEKKARYMEEYGLSAQDADLLGSSRETAEFFEATLRLYSGEVKTVANWVMGEFARLLNLEKLTPIQSKLEPEALAAMLQMIDAGEISGKIAKTVFEEMFYSGKPPREIVAEKGLAQISDESQLVVLVREILAQHPGPVADYRAGKTKALGFLVGQVMKETKGQANPGLVNKLLREELEKLP
jgi:aspartyl-tRNA(Asn)/glutamyl-tRNA(Gln) amidotransferase subunit B